MEKAVSPGQRAASALIQANAKNLAELDEGGFCMVLIRLSGLYCLLLIREGKPKSACLPDERIEAMDSVSIQEVGKRLKMNYQNIFSLSMEGDERT